MFRPGAHSQGVPTASIQSLIASVCLLHTVGARRQTSCRCCWWSWSGLYLGNQIVNRLVLSLSQPLLADNALENGVEHRGTEVHSDQTPRAAHRKVGSYLHVDVVAV